MKTTKDSVFEYIQKELMTNEACKQGINTNVIAQHFGLQRSNISTILNELVKEERLSKTNTRPVLYYLPQKENKEIYNAGKLLIVSIDVRSKRRWLSYEGIPSRISRSIHYRSLITYNTTYQRSRYVSQ